MLMLKTGLFEFALRKSRHAERARRNVSREKHFCTAFVRVTNKSPRRCAAVSLPNRRVPKSLPELRHS